MNTVQEWSKYYNSVGIANYPYNTTPAEEFEDSSSLSIHDNIEWEKAKGLHALIGKGNVRVIHFRSLSDKSSEYKDRLLKIVLRLLYLSEEYPWVICTSDTLSIIVRSDDVESMGNRVQKGNAYLLWQTKFVLPCILPQITFYHKSLPSFKSHLIDNNVLFGFFNSWNGVIEWDVVCKMKGDFAVAIKEGKKGIVFKDGTTVIEPIFDNIDHESFHDMLAYNDNSPASYSFILGTYGEGLICAKERIERGKEQYVFMDKDGNKHIVLNEAWAEKNRIDLRSISIPLHSTCHFNKGLLKIDFPIDEYCGRLYEIDKQGNARDIGGIDYKEYRNVDLLEDIDYSGYETMGYWGVNDEGLRDALDDDPDAYGNID